MDYLKNHLDYASSYLTDVKDEIERELKDVNEEIYELRAQNELLEEQLEDSQTLITNIQKENIMLQLELTEVTNELILLRNEYLKTISL